MGGLPEFEIIKTHTTKGREIVTCLINNFELENYAHIDMLLNIVEFHHESFDGGGYPRGLRMYSISLEARIVAVADVFDALTSHRPYKTAMANNEAIKMIREMSGKKIDDRLVQILIDSLGDVAAYQSLSSSNRHVAVQ